MSSEDFFPDRDFMAKPEVSRRRLSGRAWVKRNLQFWHRCTVEHDDGTSVTVVVGDMDEITAERDDVAVIDLRRGDVVFLQHWDGAISGDPAVIVSLTSEAVVVDVHLPLRRRPERRTCMLCDLLVYADLKVKKWKPGSRVFAYKALQFNPPLFLLFPAVVRGTCLDYCIEVEFDDGETAFVPTTLVEQRDIREGDIVHTCTSFLMTTVSPQEQWGSCRVLQRSGDSLLLRDEAGQRFEAQLKMVAVLPSGYQMANGKLEKIVTRLNDASAWGTVIGEPTDVFVIRTEDWRNASSDPITKADVDRLVAIDSELVWASADKNRLTEDERITTHFYAILWKGRPCFSWNGHGIRCVAPTADQLAKMIEMAIELDANVIGGDDKVHH